MSEAGARIARSPPAQAASGPQASGQMKARSISLASMAAGKAPGQGAMEPSSPSSPHHQMSLQHVAGAKTPTAAISPMAMGRS